MSRDRGDRRSSRNGGVKITPLTIAQQFANLLAAKGRFAFEAQSNTNDGTNILTLVDLVDPTRTLAPSAGTLPKPTVDAGMAGALSCTFSGTQTLACNKGLTPFRFMHDGSGMETRTVLVQTSAVVSVPLSTRSTATGFSLVLTSVPVAALYVGNGGTTVINSLAASTNLNVAKSIHSRYSSSISPVATQHVTGFSDTTQATETNSPNPGDPQNTLVLGSSNGSNFFTGRWFGSYGFLPLSIGERAIVDAYVTLQTGIAVP